MSSSGTNLISLYGKECESIYCINNVKYYEGKKCHDCSIEESEKFIPLKKQKKSHEEPRIKYTYEKKSNLIVYNMEDFNKGVKEPNPKMFSIDFLQKFYDMKV
jgi:hypothetical protein